jgi:hypothetical protein
MGVSELEQFKCIDNNMLWKGCALGQINDFSNLSRRLDAEIVVVGDHMSKSINLPVVRFKIGSNIFYLRDNFYDVNLCVVSTNPINLSYSELLSDACEEYDWDWYLGQIERCRGYTWSHFTDKEMDDPKILCVSTPHGPSKELQEWTVRKDTKYRWMKRMSSPDWFANDWSSGSICWEGEFGPGAKIFVQSNPYMQGITGLVPHGASNPYQPGKSMFALAVKTMELAEKIIRRVVDHSVDIGKR